VLFIITDAARCNRRSCQLKQGGRAFTLAALPCVDMSDVDNQIHIYKTGAFASCSCPSDILIEEMVDFIVQWLESWSGGYSAGPDRCQIDLRLSCWLQTNVSSLSLKGTKQLNYGRN